MNKPMSQSQYVSTKGLHCPFCGSNELDLSGAGNMESDENGVRQGVFCLKCKNEWVDLYKLAGYVSINRDFISNLNY